MRASDGPHGKSDFMKCLNTVFLHVVLCVFKPEKNVCKRKEFVFQDIKSNSENF